MTAKRRLVPALLLLLLACREGARELPAPAERGEASFERDAGSATDPASDAWWSAVRHLDLDGARALAGDADQHAFLDAVALALEGGSAAAEAPLCALATSDADPTLRRRAGQTALNLLRIEARWEALSDFGARCGLSLKDGAIPPALLQLPVETLAPPETPVVLPLLETDARLPLVTAVVAGPDGKAEANALVDTGAGACMLTDALAARIGLVPRGADTIPILGSAGRGAHARPAALPALHLGSWCVDDVPVLVVDGDALHALLPDVDAVIGWEILQAVALEISGVAREVVLRRSTPRPDDVPLDLVLLYEPVVRLSSSGHELLFLLDTGATGTDATPALVARLGLTELNTVEDELRGLGAEQQAVVQVIPELPLTLGGVTLGLGNVTVWEMPAEPMRLLELDGTLGADVPLAGRLVIDGPARRVTLEAR